MGTKIELPEALKEKQRKAGAKRWAGTTAKERSANGRWLWQQRMIKYQREAQVSAARTMPTA